MRYRYEGGIADFVRHLNASKEPVHSTVIDFGEDGDGISVEIAMQWNSSYAESVHTFANTINTAEGGTHEEGFRSALTTIVNRYARDQKLVREKEERPGRARTCARDSPPSSTSSWPTRSSRARPRPSWATPRPESFVQKAVNDHLRDWFDRNPGEAKDIITKATQAARARIAARQARDLTRRKGLLESSSLPGKLSDCSVR